MLRSGLHSVLPLLTSLILADVSAAEVTAKPILQMRIAVDAPSEDSEPMEVYGRQPPQTFNVEKSIVFDQTALESAKVERAGAHPCINITFTPAARRRFAAFTRDHVGTRLAVVIDGRLYCAPMIRAEIAGGRVQITGSFSEQEANDLAAKINEAIKKH